MDDLRNIELEAHVIGGCVTDCARFKQARCAGLTADVFTSEEARTVWQTMEELDDRREVFDDMKLMSRLPALSVFLAKCVDVPTFALFDDWVVDLRNLSAARIADAALMDARAELAAEPLKPDKIHSILEAIPSTYRQKATGRRLPTLKETGAALLSQMEGRTARNIPLLPNWRQSVFHAGELFVIAGVSGQGKTALATTSVNTMLDDNLTVLYCCSESSSVDILARIIAARCGVVHYAIQNREATAAQVAAYNEAFKSIMDFDGRLFIYGLGDGPMTPNGVAACLKRCAVKCGRIDVLVIDYLQDFKLDKIRSGMTQTNVMEDIIGRLHDLAVEEGAACLALSQYNKEADQKQEEYETKNGDKKKPLYPPEPRTWWIKDASKIIHAAHVVAALWFKNNEFYLKCLKHRNCGDFEIKLASNGAGFVLAEPDVRADVTDIPKEVDF